MNANDVEEALKYCLNNQRCQDCEKCDYGGRSSVVCNSLINRATELLKEQEATIDRLEEELSRTKNILNFYVNGND